MLHRSGRFKHCALVFLGEIPALVSQFPEHPIVLDHQRMEPCQRGPDLNIAQRACGEQAARAGRILQALIAQFEEFVVPREDPDQAVGVPGEEVFENIPPVRLIERVDRFARQPERVVLGHARGVFLYLNNQRGDQVNRGADLRKLPQHQQHADVILNRVQPHPRQHVSPPHEVLIERLMLMPEKRQMNRCHGRALTRRR